MLLLLATLSLFATPASAVPTPATGDYLYRVTLVRAAPGHYHDLIDLYKAQKARYEAQGDTAPFWMRHSQGDHWDFMLMFPMESYAAYYHPDRLARRATQQAAEAAFAEKFQQYAAWTEDLFVYGPSLDVLTPKFAEAGFFHIEMFQALPGKHAELRRQREMENAFYAELGHPGNLIFVRSQGAATDLFTLGFYRDLRDFAESTGSWTFAQEDAAAKAAGFKGVMDIGPYLRSLLLKHHDTLAVAIR